MRPIGGGRAAEHIDWINVAAWAVCMLLLVNVLAFVVRGANPVLMSDDWYFLDVFVRKAIDGNLHFADFFVKRVSGDHSEPFIKLILLWCFHDFDLDISAEAFIGGLIAFGCALLFRFVIFAEEKGRSTWAQHLAWVAICALIFSMNGTEIWGWALNSLQYSSFFMLPVFMWSVWRAYCRKAYVQLAVITFIMAFVGDDNAIICVVATLAALILYAALGRVSDKRVLLRIFGSVLGVLLIVRIGYVYAPTVGGARAVPFLDRLVALFDQLKSGQWVKWIEAPMTWSVASRSFLPASRSGVFRFFEFGLFGIMLLLQVWFWARAIRCEWNLQIFVSVCLMIVAYGWIAGILLYRIPVQGADYFKQDRYVRLYEFIPVSLVLMWIGSIPKGSPDASEKRVIGTGAIACLAILILQVPMSVTAWASVPARQNYYQGLAQQIYGLALNPDDGNVLKNCNSQLSLCGWPLEKRKDLLRLLQDNHLNIFSPVVLLNHPYLLDATYPYGAAGQKDLFSSMQKAKVEGKGMYGAIRSLFLNRQGRVLGSKVDVNAMRAGHVPLLLGGCWMPDGERGHASSWCGPDVTLVLRRPAPSSGLIVEGWLPWSFYKKIGRTLPVTITVTVDDVRVNKTVFDAEGPFTINVPAQDLPAWAPDSGLARVRISTDGSFVPSRISRSADTRELSMKLFEVSFLGANQSVSSR